MKNQQPPPPFMLSVLGLSGTDVQGFISMHGDRQTQTGHGRGLLNAKDSICNVALVRRLAGLCRIKKKVTSMTGYLRGTELFLSFLGVYISLTLIYLNTQLTYSNIS